MREAWPDEEVLAQHVLPQPLDRRHLREEAMAAEIETVALVLDGLGDAADRAVGLVDDAGHAAKSQDVRGRQTGRPRTEHRGAHRLSVRRHCRSPSLPERPRASPDGGIEAIVTCGDASPAVDLSRTGGPEVTIRDYLSLLRTREEGQTMAEYAVVLGVITLAVVGVFTALAGGSRARSTRSRASSSRTRSRSTRGLVDAEPAQVGDERPALRVDADKRAREALLPFVGQPQVRDSSVSR